MNARTVPWLAIVTLAVAGCSNVASPSGPSASTTSVPTSTSAASAAASGALSLLPLGTFTAEIPEGLEAAAGQWTMTIAADGITWTNPGTGASFSPGDVVEVTSDTIVFAPDPECPNQTGTPMTGTYQWHTDERQLVFTVDSDSCQGRIDTLTAAPWELAL